MIQMKWFRNALLITSIALLSTPAFALSLQEAREQGMVGEQPTGYAKALKSEGDVRKLVDEINERRKQEYQRISKENGQPVDIVAKLAAKQIIKGLPAGAMYQDDNGNWKTR